MKKDIGKTFGFLTVLERKRELVGTISRTFYYCSCSNCGSETWIRADRIKSGGQKSCGCLSKDHYFKREDITNKKFGRLTAIESTDKRAANGSVVWFCTCECGNVTEVPASDLLQGRVRSCGCLKIEMNINHGKKVGELNIQQNVIKDTHLKVIESNKPLSTNKTGFKGVCVCKRSGKYIAQISFQKKLYYLGRYNTVEEAAEIYQTAKKATHEKFLEWYKTMKEQDDKNGNEK